MRPNVRLISLLCLLGAVAGFGARARIAAEAATVSAIHDFAGTPDGAHPGSGLIFDNGRLLGITRDGGAANQGAVFELVPSDSLFGGPAREHVIYSFGVTPSDGRQPTGELLAGQGGQLFGATQSGGLGYGTIYRLTPPGPGQTGWSETRIYMFRGGPDGAAPGGGLAMDNQGRLYGTTSLADGDACNNTGCGTLFRLTPGPGRDALWRHDILHRFRGMPDDGATPSGGLLIGGGVIFGTTQFGGRFDRGTVFCLAPRDANGAAWPTTLLHSFSGARDGANPAAGLTADSDGRLYGVALNGGQFGSGTAFAMTTGPAQFRVIYAFRDLDDGAHPAGRLTLGRFGALYGTTEGDQDGTVGTVFALTPPATDDAVAWAETTLYRFAKPADAAGIRGPLVRVARGFYGAAPFGGSAGEGTAFAIRP